MFYAITESDRSDFDSNVLNRPAVTLQPGKERQTEQTFIYEREPRRETDICQRNLPVRL